MGLILAFIGIIVIAPIIAFILLALQLFVARIPVSDIWRKSEGRYGFPNPSSEARLFPELGWYISRLEAAHPDKWPIVSRELTELVSNPGTALVKEYSEEELNNILPLLRRSTQRYIASSGAEKVKTNGVILISALTRFERDNL